MYKKKKRDFDYIVVGEQNSIKSGEINYNSTSLSSWTTLAVFAV